MWVTIDAFPLGSWRHRLGRGVEEIFAMGGGCLEAGELPALWERLGAGLTVSTLPAVRSIVLVVAPWQVDSSQMRD